MGLVRAVETFDHRRGMRFSTYGVWLIRRSILEALTDSQVIRIPAKAARQLATVRRAEAELQREQRRPVSTAAIAVRTGLSTHTIRSLRSAARVTTSLDEPVGEDGTPLGELVADHDSIDPLHSVMASEDQRQVSAMLRFLPSRHREVLIRRFGLNGTQALSHAEIGDWLGLGEARSRQIEREALHRLRTIATRADRAA